MALALSPLLFMSFAFEKRIVYQKAIDFADRICQQTKANL
jgi:hypothetical protein